MYSSVSLEESYWRFPHAASLQSSWAIHISVYLSTKRSSHGRPSFYPLTHRPRLIVYLLRYHSSGVCITNRGFRASKSTPISGWLELYPFISYESTSCVLEMKKAEYKWSFSGALMSELISLAHGSWKYYGQLELITFSPHVYLTTFINNLHSRDIIPGPFMTLTSKITMCHGLWSKNS